MQLCGFTIGYYKNYDWNGAGVNICGVSIDENAGKESLSNATGTNFSMLFAQLIAAKLNVNDAGGLSIIDDAEAWLCEQANAYDGRQLIWDADFDSKAQKSLANQFSPHISHPSCCGHGYACHCSLSPGNAACDVP